MTPRMIFLSSSVRWLRSGISGMAPAAEGVAAAGPGPPRGPCGADIFYTQWLKNEKVTVNQQHRGRYYLFIYRSFLSVKAAKCSVWFAEGTAAYRQHDILVSGIMNIIIIIIIITVVIIIIIITACCANRRQNRNYRLHPQLVQCSR